MDFAQMAELCAPGVAIETLSRIASVESDFNPYAIGVVGGVLQRQPRSLAEAQATAGMLRAQGFDYSVGLMQVNQKNFAAYGLSHETAFDPCLNINVGSLIFQDCYKRAGASDRAYGDALSCYYSGNFKTGYRVGYVAKVLNAGLGQPAFDRDVAIAVTPKMARRMPPARPASIPGPEPIFVTSISSPVKTVAENDLPPTAKGPSTALLF